MNIQSAEEKIQKMDAQLVIRCTEEFYFSIDDAAHKIRTTKADLLRKAAVQYLKALEKAETLVA